MRKPISRHCSKRAGRSREVILVFRSADIMAARSRRGAESSAETHKENGKGENPNRKTIEAIKDATGQHWQYRRDPSSCNAS